MASMMLHGGLTRARAALRAFTRTPAAPGSHSAAALFLFGIRSLSDGSSGRYVPGQGFVEGGFEQENVSWPPPQPPTHGGFVAQGTEGYANAQVPPTQGGFVDQGLSNNPSDAFVPVTQGGFVDNNAYRQEGVVEGHVDYNTYQPQAQVAHGGFVSNEYGHASYQQQFHGQYAGPPSHGAFAPNQMPADASAYGGQAFVQAPQPQAPQVTYGQGQPHPAHISPVYNLQPPYAEPQFQGQPGYGNAYQQLQPEYTFAQPNTQPPAFGQDATWSPAVASNHSAGYTDNFVPQVQQAEWAQTQATPYGQEPGYTPQQDGYQPQVQEQLEAADGSYVQHSNEWSQAVSTVPGPEGGEQMLNLSQMDSGIAPATGSEVDAQGINLVDQAQDLQHDQHEVSITGDQGQTESENLLARTEETENADHAVAPASTEDQSDYDATAAAMADAGVSSEESETGARTEDAADAEAGDGSLKGLESLSEGTETPKAPASPLSQNESFLDILSKTNLNIRQNKPRPQLGIRPQRKTYARIHNLPRQILKSDIVNYFSDLNLQKENVHITYDEKFYPLYVQIAFDSSEALRNAQKILQTKGRFGGRQVRMEPFIQFAPPGHPQISDTMKNYLGRMLLMLHLPPEGRVEDVERFFDGYGYDPSALTMLDTINMTLARFPKEGNRPVRRAAIGFFSSFEAMRALREKQGDFVLNEPVELRLIQ